MNVQGQAVQKHVEPPSHPVPRKYIEPILYLADRMTQQDRVQPHPGKRVVDQFAEALGVKDFRRQPWFRQINDQAACEALDLEIARTCALVLLSLILKADTTRGENARAYFTKVRELLGSDPITVPAELEVHKELAQRFLMG